MTHTIYASHLDSVQRKLARLAKKAERYSVPFSFSIGEEHPVEIAIREYDYVTQTVYTAQIIRTSGVDIEIDCESLIRKDGWTVLASLEHGKEGNIVTPFGQTQVPDEWYSIPSHCDHCHTNRFRSVTFMVSKDGETRQVGRSCLKDYTGISPDLALLFDEVQTICDPVEMSAEQFASSGLESLISVPDVLARACDSIRARGYRPVNETRSTKDDVRDRLTADPTPEGIAKATEILGWLMSTEGDSEKNCQILAKSGWCKPRHLGILCWLPMAYEIYLERKAREEKIRRQKEAEKSSEYVGQIGQRITFQSATALLLTSLDTQYGTTYLHKFTDADGNVFVWFASTSPNLKDGATITGTVKDHSERDGVKQTILTRCKIA